jgi:TolB protein
VPRNVSRSLLLLAVTATLFATRAHPQSRAIDVTKSGAVKSTISLSSLDCEGAAAGEFLITLRNDLERSGWFSVTDSGNAAFAVRGTCSTSGTELNAGIRILNEATGKTQLRESYNEESTEPRKLAHRVCDDIVAAVKGRTGIASTRIVMIGTLTGSKEVFVCDYDGRNLTQLTRDGSISVAPSWSHNAGGIIYTSFRASFPYVYLIDMLADPPDRKRLTSFPGLNVCAAVSPDGKRMAISLSKDGNPDLYIMEMKSKRLTRVTRTPHAAEASPSWSPDGKKLVFVSDSSGQPNIYTVNRDGSGLKPITSTGAENVSPDWGPDGKIVYAGRRSGSYQLFVIDPDNPSDNRQLTHDNADHEDPSWAPDGRHLVYAHTANYRSAI